MKQLCVWRLVVSYSVLILFSPSVLKSQCVAGQTGGVVWRDFNGNGIQDATETQGVSDITVKIFNAAGTLVNTVTTNASGQYTFGTLSPVPSSTVKYRIEFSNISALDFPTYNGTNGRTDVQFVAAAGCTYNFGVNNPADYCQSNPKLATSCYVSGDPLASGSLYATDAAIVSVDYNHTTAKTALLNAAAVGSIWGIAYNKKTDKMYLSSFLRRHAGLGPAGIGAVYIYPNASTGGGAVTSFTIPNAGTIGSNSARGLSGSTPANFDATAFDLVGKIGLGGSDIDIANQMHYVVNLNDKKVYKTDLTAGVLSPVALPSYTAPTCTNGTFRPFALKIRNGKLYLGGVCSGETEANGSTNKTNLNATVLVYDIATNAWTGTATSFSLNYAKEEPYPGYDTGWYPWIDQMTDVPVDHSMVGEVFFTWPTPILSDIEFSDDGSMNLGFLDRSAMQFGARNYGTNTSNTSTLYYIVSGGDILHATPSGSTFTTESIGSTASNEFYKGDIYPAPGEEHLETSLGGLVVVPNKNQVVMTAIDPKAFNSGGFYWLSTQTGAKQDTFEIYKGVNTASVPTFGKAAGLGDVEAVCQNPPLQIGNYVWIDTDKDGVQDPNESPLSNVTVTLWKGGTQIASTTTNTNGEYYFSSKSVLGAGWTGTGADTTLLPSTAYEVRILMSQSGIATPSYSLTTANSTTNSGDDQNDSDASLVSGSAVITLTTGVAGSTNHTYDFGFVICTAPTLTGVSADTATCTNGVANSNAAVHVTGITGMTKYAYTTNGTTGLFASTATASTASSINLTGLANPSVSTTYTFRLWGVDTTCFNDTTVILTPSVCPQCSITGTFTQNACNNNGTAAIMTDDYFTVTVSSVSATNGGASGKYEVVLNGTTVLNTGGTAYGSPVTVGGAGVFAANGTTTYTLTVRDLDNQTCASPNFVTTAMQNCSVCPISLCLPVIISKSN